MRVQDPHFLLILVYTCSIVHLTFFEESFGDQSEESFELIEEVENMPATEETVGNNKNAPAISNEYLVRYPLYLYQMVVE